MIKSLGDPRQFPGRLHSQRARDAELSRIPFALFGHVALVQYRIVSQRQVINIIDPFPDAFPTPF